MIKKTLILTAIAAIIGLSSIGISSHAEPGATVDRMDIKGSEVATFAGGCFWCSESDFEKVDGVINAVSGFTGGTEKNPTYKDVSYGKTSHLEGVQVHYDPSKISYKELLDVFWRHINPTDSGGQFVDRGTQYSTGIFYHNETQRNIAETSKQELIKTGKFDKPIVTPILEFTAFYQAENYHQDFYKVSPYRYKSYRKNSGRDQFIKKTWGNELKILQSKDSNMGQTKKSYSKPDDATLKNKLSSIEYKVTQKNGTEPPFDNLYWDNKKKGIYVDIVSGEPLFDSQDKYKSGTGWPSFTKTLAPENVVEVKDKSFFMTRTEVRSKHGSSHLGHLFNDGPEPLGLRYCINSAALKFIPEEKLIEEGYGEFHDR